MTDFDLDLFNERTHAHMYRKPGADPIEPGVAQTAAEVSVIGDFNGWRAGDHPAGQSGYLTYSARDG